MVRLADPLPDSRIALLPGQDHIAILFAPELVAREVLAFVRAAG